MSTSQWGPLPILPDGSNSAINHKDAGRMGVLCGERPIGVVLPEVRAGVSARP